MSGTWKEATEPAEAADASAGLPDVPRRWSGLWLARRRRRGLSFAAVLPSAGTLDPGLLGACRPPAEAPEPPA